MAIRVTLECGHSAVLRSKPTPEGYTHDWEVFVRGVNNADINHYVEKVVFHLHDTFPNPRRTIKSPPYIVKESGYAGFVIPIHIYLRNKDVPKKFIIHYDLQLQHSGPAINTLTKHSEIFSNPSDEFRKLLLKGGAALVHNTEGPSDKFESKLALPMTGKPKLSGADAKKHRPTEPKPASTFTDLFGIPIKTGKISPDSNKKLSSEKSMAKQNLIADRTDKSERNQKSKHGQHKDLVKEKTSDDRREKKEKEKDSYSKEKSREKYKRALSPSGKDQISPKMKRTISPSPVRKTASPKRSSSPKFKEKDLEKVKSEKEKEKEKMREVVRNSEETKSERKKDKKRHKEDREKEKKDKHKEKERDKSKESKSNESKKTLEKAVEKQEKRIEKSEAKGLVKEEKKSPKAKEYEKAKEEKITKIEKDKIEKTEKKESKSTDKEKQQKHKHKKKDKKEKRDGSRDREKKERRDKSKSLSDKSTSSTISNTNNALSTLMAEVPGNDSDSHSEEDSFEGKSVKKEPEEVMPEPMRMDEDFVKKEKSERHKRDKQSKLSRSEDRENRKRKRKNEMKLEEEQRELKKVRENSTSPALEPVSSSQSPVATESERIKEAYSRESAQKALEREQEQVTPDSTNSALVDMENFESLGFSEEYVLQLKELQQKIMTLQDNNELQRVVQVIAETGQYEITTKTFDFDLCTLDRSTVQRLQKFFSGS